MDQYDPFLKVQDQNELLKVCILFLVQQFRDMEYQTFDPETRNICQLPICYIYTG